MTPTSHTLQGKRNRILIMAAARNQQVMKHTIRLFSSMSGKEGLAAGGGGSGGTGSPGISSDELDESEVIWPSFSPPQPAGPWPTWKNIADGTSSPSTVGSLPMNIPEWSKLRCRSFDEEDEDEDDEAMLPPHEVVWRRRAESFSVVEGIGRTLKGRDLSRLRNAVWAQTGFQD